MTTVTAAAVAIDKLTDLEVAIGLDAVVKLIYRFGMKQAYTDCAFAYGVEIERRRLELTR